MNKPRSSLVLRGPVCDTSTLIPFLGYALTEHIGAQYRAGQDHVIIKAKEPFFFFFLTGSVDHFFLGLSSYSTGFALHPSTGGGFS